MAIITQKITNNLNYQFTIPCPGENNNQNANLIIPASAVDLDLLTLTTEDNLWTLQPQLLSLQRTGAISVTGTVDTATFSYGGGGSGITQLTSDVTAGPGTGSQAATVVSVGGSSASNVHSAELAANAATNANTVSTIVKRDASGNFSAGTITASLTGIASGNLANASSSTIADTVRYSYAVSQTFSGAGNLVTKSYVDAIASGLRVKASCNYATVTVLPFSPTYTHNGVSPSGQGDTLTATSFGALIVDGSDTHGPGMIAGTTRLLVKNQADETQNGIYIVTVVGDGSTDYILTRSSDFDNSTPNNASEGDFTFINDGTINEHTGWVATNDSSSGAPIVFPTTLIGFTQFSSAGVITAGAGLLLTGNSLGVDPSATLAFAAADVTNTTDQLVLGTTRTVTISAPEPASASRTVTIPDLSGDYSVVGTIGTQSIDGAKTLTSALTITPSTNQLILGTTHTTTINSTAPAASRVYTIPDAGSDSYFIMSRGNQSINGSLTLGSLTALLSCTIGNSSIHSDTQIVVGTTTGPRIVTIPEIGTNANFVMSEGSQTLNGLLSFTKPPTLPQHSFTSANTPVTADARITSLVDIDVDGDLTIDGPSNGVDGQKMTFRIVMGGTHTVTIATGAGNFRFGTDITSYTNSASGKTDYLGAIWNDDGGVWDLVSVVKGF